MTKKARELETKYNVKLHPEFLSEIDVSVTETANQEDLLQILRMAIEGPY